MREVEPGDVHPSRDHLLQDVRVGAGRPDGADDARHAMDVRIRVDVELAQRVEMSRGEGRLELLLVTHARREGRAACPAGHAAARRRTGRKKVPRGLGEHLSHACDHSSAGLTMRTATMEKKKVWNV